MPLTSQELGGEGREVKQQSHSEEATPELKPRDKKIPLKIRFIANHGMCSLHGRRYSINREISLLSLLGPAREDEHNRSELLISYLYAICPDLSISVYTSSKDNVKRLAFHVEVRAEMCREVSREERRKTGDKIEKGKNNYL